MCARMAVQVVSVRVLQQPRVVQTVEESAALAQVGLERRIRQVPELLVAHMQHVQAQLEAWVLAAEQRVLRQLLQGR